MQLISCRLWTSRYGPYPSLTKEMKTYLELKDQVADPPHPCPTYHERSDMPSLQKAQTSKDDTSKEKKKRTKSQQTDKRQYKVRVVEMPIIVPRVSATLIPTTAAATPSTMFNPRWATTPWPSSIPASVNLFVTRTWSIPPSKESSPALVKQKMVESDLPK